MDMGFNPYAFVKPTTKAEYSALLDEAIRMANELSDQILEINRILEEAHNKK